MVFLLGVVFLCGLSLSAQELKIEILAKTTKSWDGSTIPPYLSGQPEITILKITIPSQAIVDWHNHPVILMGYLLKGELTVESAEGKTVVFKEGDTVVEIVNKLHRGINRGKNPVEIIVFYAGNVGVPNAINR